MKNSVKIVFIDIDDTLVGKSGIIHDTVELAIHEAKEKGIRLVVSTGRPGFGEALNYFANFVDPESFHSFFNGGVIKNALGKLLYSSNLTRENLNVLIETAREFNFALEYYTDNQIYVEKNYKIAELHQKLIGFPAKLVEDLHKIEFLPIKVQYVVEEKNVGMILEKVKLFNLDYGVGKNAKLPGVNFISVLPKNTSKLHSAKKILDYYQIDQKNAMMIGDSQGDLDLIEYVSFGVAVENSTDEVKRSAKYVVSSADEGGVADAIRIAIKTWGFEND
jgi:Cof subfamily protein (haloacid dehalogenase superfamily)